MDRHIAILLLDDKRLPLVRRTVDILMANAAAPRITVFSAEA